MVKIKKKSGQEEMIGFALIVIIVAVIILIFISFSLTRPQKEPVESYEVESFIQSLLQYTSDCEDNLGYLSVQKLIASCFDNEICVSGKTACEVMNSTLKGIIDESWKVGEKNPTKGYSLEILSGTEKIISFEEGNATNNYKGAMQPLGRNNIEVVFNAYY